VLELGSGGEEIDGEDVETKRDTGAPGIGDLVEVRTGHLAEHDLLVVVDLNLGGDKVAYGSGFDLEEDEGVAVPGDEVEVSRKPRRAPAAGDDRVTKAAEVEIGGVFATLAGDEVRRERRFAVGEGAESGVDFSLEGKNIHAETIQRFHRFPNTRAAKNTLASLLPRIDVQC
jgi:hypothetical protein